MAVVVDQVDARHRDVEELARQAHDAVETFFGRGVQHAEREQGGYVGLIVHGPPSRW